MSLAGALYSSPIIGRIFERQFKDIMTRANYGVIRVHDSVVIYSKGKKTLSRREKSPFDYILCKDGKSIFVDCKVTKKHLYQLGVIPGHQVSNLEIASQGGIAGFAIYFRMESIDAVYFYSVRVIKEIMIKANRFSLKPSDGDLLFKFGKDFDSSKIKFRA